eukprot:scaffold1046_cov162-Ochromonas_danica.AAC.11
MSSRSRESRRRLSRSTCLTTKCLAQICCFAHPFLERRVVRMLTDRPPSYNTPAWRTGTLSNQSRLATHCVPWNGADETDQPMSALGKTPNSFSSIRANSSSSLHANRLD